MLKVLTDLFDSIGMHPIIGGFILGVLTCSFFSLLRLVLGVEAKKSSADELARFRDPDAFASGTTAPSTSSLNTVSPANATAKTRLQPYAGAFELPDDLTQLIVQRLSEGRKIEAIKLFKDATGLGLKESKDAIESLSDHLPK